MSGQRVVQVTLFRHPSGEVDAGPASALTPELRAFIRASKETLPEGVQHLIFCADQPSTEVAPDAHRTWLIHFPDRPSLQVLFVPDATREQTMAGYPGAVSAEPYQPTDKAPDAAMLEQEQAAVRSWLRSIGETDPDTIAEVLARCEQDQGARAYFLGRAAQASEAQEERTAILEFDAGVPRAEAEQATGCQPLLEYVRPSLPVYTGDDERRTCSQCLNLQKGICIVAEPGGLVSARAGYRPSPDLPLRCAGYLPGAEDPDQRPAAQRWPNWSFT